MSFYKVFIFVGVYTCVLEPRRAKSRLKRRLANFLTNLFSFRFLPLFLLVT